jgi:hypothetical protein
VVGVWWERLPLNAATRTVLQGVVVTAAVAAFLAARAAVNSSGPLNWATVGRVAGQAAVMAVLAYAVHRARGEQVAVPEVHLDALARAARTLFAGLAVTVATAAVGAVQAAAGAGTFDPQTLAGTIGTAAAMAAVAWLHRVAADPSPLPSAAPPAPTGQQGWESYEDEESAR